MSRKRKVYPASFRAQVTMAAIRGDKTVNDLATQYEVSSQMVLKMKTRLKERIEEIFQDEHTQKIKSEGETTPEELFEQIGRLKYENDWLKKICHVRMRRSVG